MAVAAGSDSAEYTESHAIATAHSAVGMGAQASHAFAVQNGRLGLESWDCPTFVLHGFVTAAVHAAVSCRSAVGTGNRKEWVSDGFRRSL